MSTPRDSKVLSTPSSSDIEADTRKHLPPSPPLSPRQPLRPSLSPVDRLLGVFRSCKAGRSLPGGSDWRTFRLSPAELAELEQEIEEDEHLWGWYEDKCRYDYDPTEGRYTLRMPSAVHEFFIADVERAIIDGIAACVENLEKSGDYDGDVIAKALREVHPGRSPTLYLNAPKLENSSQKSRTSGEEAEVVVRRSPDATFFHPSALLPPLVVEVSYSQQRKELPRLAESYIVDSQHAIRCVIGLDIPYAEKKKSRVLRKDEFAKEEKAATGSVWRPSTEADEDGDEVGICRQDMDASPFRTASGEPCTGVLELALSDLLPSSVLSPLPASAANEKISIPFADLAAFLTTAERFAKLPPKSEAASSYAPKRFRKRKRTPSEELSSGREDEYLRLEVAELERERADDREWRARSRRRVSGIEGVEVVERRRSARRRSGRSVGGAS